MVRDTCMNFLISSRGLFILCMLLLSLSIAASLRSRTSTLISRTTSIHRPSAAFGEVVKAKPAAHRLSSTTEMASVPKMSLADQRIYGRLAEQMTFYHSMLRSSWDKLYDGTAPGTKKVSAPNLIRIGLQFCNHLKGHHDIEEAYWFPVLAKKMDEFGPGQFAREQHKEMHKGLDVLVSYLEVCQAGEQDLRREEVRRIMDSFGGILWTHMDEEVAELGAENMMKYWSKEEMRRLPF